MKKIVLLGMGLVSLLSVSCKEIPLALTCSSAARMAMQTQTVPMLEETRLGVAAFTAAEFKASAGYKNVETNLGYIQTRYDKFKTQGVKNMTGADGVNWNRWDIERVRYWTYDTET